MISIDNAVELTAKTFLGLPERARGAPGPPRRRLDEATQSFPRLLDVLEEYATKQLVGIALDDIEWYHRLRNQLYHDGNGITVERSKVEAYLQLARALFENLFDEELRLDIATAAQTRVGGFLVAWNDLQVVLRERLPPKKPGDLAYYRKREYLEGLSPTLRTAYDELSLFRNQVVHGLETPTPEALERMTEKVKLIDRTLRAEGA